MSSGSASSSAASTSSSRAPTPSSTSLSSAPASPRPGSPGSGAQPCDAPRVMYAAFDYEAADTASQHSQLSLTTGEKLLVIQETSAVWFYCEREHDKVRGYAPVSYLVENMGLDWQDEEYFGSYGPLKIHREMLLDTPRTLAYKRAIEAAAPYLAGRTVLDVGCGTGILSMFCARAGAQHVYAVEASESVSLARKIVAHNGLADRISVLQTKVEDAQLPEKVDMIVSEWMGTFLIFEYMIESVILARERLLKPGGTMMPSAAHLHLVPVSASDKYHELAGLWADLYGFDMTPLVPMAKKEFLQRPVHDYTLKSSDFLADPQEIMSLCMSTVTVLDLETHSSDISFTIQRGGMLHGFGSWFDVDFGPPAVGESEAVVLSTSPDSPLTHWKQDLFLLDEPLSVAVGDTIKGTIITRRNLSHRRHLRIHLDFKLFRCPSADSRECAAKEDGSREEAAADHCPQQLCAPDDHGTSDHLLGDDVVHIVKLFNLWR